MTCPFAQDDGAYVLGALAPGERLDFEQHLRGCEECARSVRELAGLPGLLGRVDPDSLETAPVDDRVPATLLPSLSKQVARSGRRRVLVAAGAAAVVAALVTGTVLTAAGTVGGDPSSPAPPSTGPSSTTASPVARQMTPVGEVPVRASVTMERTPWGTLLVLECTYDPASVTFDLPPDVDYLLMVRTRDGRTERVGSWRSVEGATTRLPATTAADTDDIASVQVRTPEGQVVLELAT